MTTLFAFCHFLAFIFSTPFSRRLCALVAQSVERVLGKDEVGGSSPLEGSIHSENLIQTPFTTNLLSITINLITYG